MRLSEPGHGGDGFALGQRASTGASSAPLGDIHFLSRLVE
jgi:hypothetical protein